MMMMTPLEAQLTEEVAALRLENKLLREKIDLLVRRIFGASSEKMDEQQLMLLLQGGDEVKKPEASSASPGVLEAEIEKADLQATTRKKKSAADGGREPRIPAHLPVSERIVIEPQEVQADPAAWRHISDEVTEQLDYKPGSFTKRLIVRPKYVRRDHAYSAPIIAELPTLQEGCKGAPGLIAKIAVAKFADHLPLYRQEQIFAQRHSLALPRQTMCRWLGLAADWLQLIHKQMLTEITAGSYMQVDETPIEYLEPGNGRTKVGYLWVCKQPGGDAVYTWATSRAASVLSSLIPADFSGTLQSDGYSAYPCFIKERDKANAANEESTVDAADAARHITLAGCWAHARRKFYEAYETGKDQHSGFIIRQIQQLYRIERELRESRAGPRVKQAVRATHSRMISERIQRVLKRLQERGKQLPKSALGRAIDYTLNQWGPLSVYLEDGRIEIDNNQVENAIRPTAVGKKNWLFIGEAQAGQRSAIYYTLIEACRRRRIDPQEYLRDVLTRLPTLTNQQIAELTPEQWAKARAEEAPESSPRPPKFQQARESTRQAA